MNQEIKRQTDNLKFCQDLAMDILKILTDEQLDFTIGKNMGTLGEQFRHMARVRFQYGEALESKKIASTKEIIESNVAKSKKELISLLERASQKVWQILESMSDEEINNLKVDWRYWGIDSMNIYEHLQALIDHENLHNGEIIVYIRTLGLNFPKSWEAWGL